MSLSSTLPFFRGHLRARPLRMLRTELKRPLAEVMVRPANRRGSTRGEADLYEPERNVPLLADRDAPTVGAIDSLTEAQATTTCFVGIRRRSAAPQIGKPIGGPLRPYGPSEEGTPANGGPSISDVSRHRRGGDDGSRTHDLFIANEALCQLSYVPEDVHHRQAPWYAAPSLPAKPLRRSVRTWFSTAARSTLSVGIASPQ